MTSLKKITLIIVLAALWGCQSSSYPIVEASCGQCQFGMEGEGCDLAVRLEGNSYFVAGTDIDSHGDAHATEGFCNAIRHAQVEGVVKDGKFVASHFELVD